MAFLARRAAGPCVSPCSTRHSLGAATRPSRSSGCSEPIIKRRSTTVIREPLTTATKVGVMDLSDAARVIACCHELKDKLQRMPGPADEEPLTGIENSMHSLIDFYSSIGSVAHDPAEVRDQPGNMQEALAQAVTTASGPHQPVLQLRQTTEQLATGYLQLLQQHLHVEMQRREQVQQLQHQIEQQQQQIQVLKQQASQQWENLDEVRFLAVWQEAIDDFMVRLASEVQREHAISDWCDVAECMMAEEALPESEQHMTATVKAVLMGMGLTWEQWQHLMQVASEESILLPAQQAVDPTEMQKYHDVDSVVMPQHLEHTRDALRKMAQVLNSPGAAP